MRDTLGFFKLGCVFLQLPLPLLDYRFCLALLADIGNCSNELEVAQAVPRWVSGHTHMLDGAVGQLQAMLKIKTVAAKRCLIDLLLHPFAVLPVDLREDNSHRRFRPWITLEDSEGLVGPKDLPARNAPAETARVTEPLSFRQVRFAPAEFLGQKLVFRYVYGAANVFFQALVFDNGSTDAANVPDLTVGTNNALYSIEGRSFRQDPLDQVCHGLAILLVNTIQVFLNTKIG